MLLTLLLLADAPKRVRFIQLGHLLLARGESVLVHLLQGLPQHLPLICVLPGAQPVALLLHGSRSVCKVGSAPTRGMRSTRGRLSGFAVCGEGRAGCDETPDQWRARWNWR
ncbi:hypothetical protein [Caenibius sp. WL]|uniref:hypothetical protein n=1 Tax=Caenibius sp. WL TaxID=2872646 RepID=UPI001C98F26D|nr:hypothetical protein [Caenibius sp. WL]QZP08134.1 hypothetical protein K5X80_16115 [Caenibius sp. WL]